MRKLAIVFILMAIVGCQSEGSSLVLEVTPEGYFIAGEKVTNLHLFFRQYKNPESTNLAILASSSAKTEMLVTAVEYSKNAKFKNVSLSAVEP